jgi:hypothetical protein
VEHLYRPSAWHTRQARRYVPSKAAGGGPLTITSDVLEDETGATLVSTTLTRAYAIRLSDHTLVASWASPATNGSGVLSLSDAALTAAPHLLVTVGNSNADAGAKVYTPA